MNKIKRKFCECGCNEPVNKKKRFVRGHHLRLAKFRIKEFSKESNEKRINSVKEYYETHSHSKKGKILYKGKFVDKEKVILPLCKCGCGEKVEKLNNNYIHGHNPTIISKGRIPWNKGLKGVQVPWNKGTGKARISILCKCGCGEMTALGKSYISGHNQIGKKQSKESIKKRVLKCKGQKRPDGNWNPWTKGLTKENSSIIKKMAKKTSKTMKEKFLDPKFCDKWFESHGVLPNKFEMKIDNILQEIFPNEWKYVGNFDTFIGGKCPDFLNINGQKKLIECFGDYWHKKEDEKERKDHFKKYGFDTLFIWEHELKSEKRIKNKIEKFYNR